MPSLRYAPMESLPTNMTCYQCGSRGKLCCTYVHTMQPRYQIVCPKCHASTTPSFEMAKAIQKWRDIQIAQVIQRHSLMKGGATIADNA